MKIPQTPPLASTDASRNAIAPERAILESLTLREGQATLARVLEQGSAGPRGSVRLILDLGGQTIPVDSDMELQPGTLIRLQRSGNSLRLMETLSSPSPDSLTGALTQALARKLPAQFDIQAGLKLIAALSRALTGVPGNAPAASPASSPAVPANPGPPDMPGPEATRIRAALARVISVLPQQSELQGGGPIAASNDSRAALIRAWVQNSGLFTEARLASITSLAAPPADKAPTDLKSQVLRLAVELLKTDTLNASNDLRQLRPAVTPDLIQQALQFPLAPVSSRQSGQQEAVNAGVLLRILAGMVNRITVNQLHSQSLSTSATADGSAPPQTWLLELPWLNPQQEPKVLQVRVERHSGDTEEEPDKTTEQQHSQWRLNLALDLDEFGPLYFDLALTGNTLATKIWAEQEATWRLVDNHTGQLRENLGALGLVVKSLDCRHGKPSEIRTRLDQRLVDEKA